MTKSKYYVTEVNYSKRSMKIVDIIFMDLGYFDYYDKYKVACENRDDDTIGYYAAKDKHHKWAV